MDFEEPKPWSEVPWNNSDKELAGISIKGKAKIFKNYSSKVGCLLKKRAKVFRVNDTKIKVVKHTYKKAAMCCEMEVEGTNGITETVETTIYQPSGTITLLRKPEVNPSFLDQLCKVLIAFLDTATADEVINWSSRLKAKPIPVKTAVNKCTLCSYETKNKVSLKRHYTIVHTKEVANTKGNKFKCPECNKCFKNNENVMNHTKKYHNVQESTMEFLQNRVNELEQLVSKLQQKETSVDNIDEKSMSEAGSENQMNIDEVQQVPDVESDHEMNIDEPVFKHKQDKIGNVEISTEKEVKIPAHLKSVNSNHLTLLKGYRMFSQSVGNGACGTNCGSMHMFEDNSEEAMIKMKRKINYHIAEHYDEIYANVIGLPYSE